MAEEMHRVETFAVHYKCDVEGCDGEVTRGQDSMMLACNPPLYPHSCNKCKKSYRFKLTYPTIRYVTVKE